MMNSGKARSRFGTGVALQREEFLPTLPTRKHELADGHRIHSPVSVSSCAIVSDAHRYSFKQGRDIRAICH